MSNKYSSSEFTYNFIRENNENVDKLKNLQSIIPTDTLLLRAILVQLEELNKKCDKITPLLKK